MSTVVYVLIMWLNRSIPPDAGSDLEPDDSATVRTGILVIEPREKTSRIPSLVYGPSAQRKLTPSGRA